MPRITGIRVRTGQEHYISSISDFSRSGFGGVISSFLHPGTTILLTIEVEEEPIIFIPATVRNCDHFLTMSLGGYRFGASIDCLVSDADLVKLMLSFELLASGETDEVVEK